MSILTKFFGDPDEKYIRALQPIVDHINELEDSFKGLSDEQLCGKTDEFRERLNDGKTLDDILPEGFAAVREAARRTLGQRHFDVQLMGGIAMHRGSIVEMRTGEGKTLVATLPSYLNAIEGKGVHVVTVNDYLARRDAIWMGQIFHALGLSTGCINHDASYVYDPEHRHSKNQESRIKNKGEAGTKNNQDIKQDEHDKERDAFGGFRIVHEYLRPVRKRESYEADILYGTNNEFGFDYLRDNMAYELGQMAQRPDNTHHFVIVDEVDSILIDEARTPLIISAPDEESPKLYDTFARVVPALKVEEDYTVDEKRKAVSITDSGIEKVEKKLGIDNIYSEDGTRYAHFLEQALKAHILFKLDRDYVVKNGEIVIVDEFTGRLMPGRRWSDGLHQSVEAKEGVQVRKESRTLATITLQNYFRLYKKLSGMTGTALSSAEEFFKVYKLEVVNVPTNKPMIRDDMPDRIYKTGEGKLRAVAREIKERHESGQPILVGTVSIEKNEIVSALLEREGVEHNVLNAKNHEREAEIIAQAGNFRAVTVATNMAGRGVDIILGGNPPDLEQAKKVKNVGGLHVIGTERHEARRIDDQLRGRSGRQGDEGSSQFFVSTEDDLARVFGGDRLRSIMDRLGVGDDDVIENRMVSNAIQQAQGKVEGHNFDIRKYVLEYDDVMSKHRNTIYTLRQSAMRSKDTRDITKEYFRDVLHSIVSGSIDPETGTQNAKFIMTRLSQLAQFPETSERKIQELSQEEESTEKITDYAYGELTRLYEEREKELGAETLRNLERAVLLRAIDEVWVGHLEAMEQLRDSVQLRGYGQRDPLVEYKVEARKMFGQLLDTVKLNAVFMVFRADVRQQPRVQRVTEERRDITGKEKNLMQKDIEQAGREVHREESQKVGRNDPCPCGSGKKYKKCHGR